MPRDIQVIVARELQQKLMEARLELEECGADDDALRAANADRLHQRRIGEPLVLAEGRRQPGQSLRPVAGAKRPPVDRDPVIQHLRTGHAPRGVEHPRDTAVEDEDLIRTKVNMIPESVKEIRVVDIVGLDKQADGGTHVHSTDEVGRIRVLKTESKGKGNKRIRIEIVDA